MVLFLCKLFLFTTINKLKFRKSMDAVESWSNPVVERLTGMGNGNNYNAGLRNESYYMV